MDIGSLLKAFAISLGVTVISGPLVIPFLRRVKFGQTVRTDGPSRHLKKTGTPTMGGIMFLAGIIVSGILLAINFVDGLLVLGVTIGYGMIGFLDDFIKVTLKRPLGLRAREKLLGQVVLAAALAFFVVFYLGRGTDLVVPFSGFFSGGPLYFDPGWWLFLVFTILVVVGTANAVNLTDGLDGLAAGVSFFAALAYLLIAVWMDKAGTALVMAAVAGGCMGFLAYNRFPALVFMGDTGSLALGGALGAAAVITRSELLLLVVGGVFVLETLSVILQVISFQLTGRRLFRMSPLHHHFELAGWPETRVVAFFWLLALGFAMLGLTGLTGLV